MRETILLAKLRITERVRETIYIGENILFWFIGAGRELTFLIQLGKLRPGARVASHISDPAPILVQRLAAGALGLLGPAGAGGGVEHGDQDSLPEPALLSPLLARPHWGMNIRGSSQIETKLNDGH